MAGLWQVEEVIVSKNYIGDFKISRLAIQLNTHPSFAFSSCFRSKDLLNGFSLPLLPFTFFCTNVFARGYLTINFAHIAVPFPHVKSRMTTICYLEKPSLLSTFEYHANLGHPLIRLCHCLHPIFSALPKQMIGTPRTGI